MERCLKQPIALHMLAKRAGFSLWHFHRIFSEYTGDSIGTYLRRRRLTAAAEELSRTRRGILEIALEYQFESHAAFTRAFKAAFDVSPSKLRRTGSLSWHRTRPVLTPDKLRNLSTQITMTPTILELPNLHLLGLSVRFIRPNSPRANNVDVIPKLYARFCPLLPTLPPSLDQYIYGAARCPSDIELRDPDELEYLAAIHVAPETVAKEPLVSWKIPAATYACFTHRGPVSKLGETIQFVFGTWLPRSGYRHGDGPNLDRQDERFGDGGKDCQFEFLIPIHPKER